MLQAITAGQSREIEARFVATSGQPLATLMQRAGQAVAREVEQLCPEGRVLVLVGPGNNGGDGWVAATSLTEKGRDVAVCAMRSPEELSGDAAAAARIAVEAGVRWSVCDPDKLRHEFTGAAVLVDALLGTGSRLPLRDEVGAWCAAISESGLPVLAVDLPTGVDGDTGRVDEVAVSAALTVTFIAPKRGLVLYPGAALAGDVVVADLGIESGLAEIDDALEVWESDDFARLIPLPAPEEHKNSRGRVLIVAGSRRFPGAAVLAARGAMRSGAGYVTLAVPEPIVSVVQAHLQAAPVVGLPADAGGSFSAKAAVEASELAAAADAVVLGPGLTMAEGARRFACELYSAIGQPLVVDADALNALAELTHSVEKRAAPTVLTPHPGELARLLGSDVGAVQSDRVFSSARLAGPDRVVVLKGAGTVISGADRQVVVTSGTPALATAGTGDVLSGVIGALLAQGLGPLEAAVLGAQLHGVAGELAAADLTPVCVNAEDVPDYLPGAVASLLEW